MKLNLLPNSELLLKAGVSVTAMSRSETPELTALASTYPGVLNISKGDVAIDSDNKVRSATAHASPRSR